MEEQEKLTNQFNIAPIVLQSYIVKNISDNKQIGKFTTVLINDPELGVITPDKYRLISNRSQLCVQLSKWSFVQIENMSRSFQKSLKDGFLTVYVPYKMLTTDVIDKLLIKVSNSARFSIDKLVLELSSDVLYENTAEVCRKMSRLKELYNVKFMLSEYGGEFCPVLRLSSFDFDYIISDSAICNKKTLSSPFVKDAVSIAKANNAHVIFGCPYKRLKLTSLAKEIGFDSYLSNSVSVPDGRLINV